ncbi:MAG: shikimate kinase, partial [Terriglobales bacterium]
MEVRAVFLVGFMACGKSTVGQELARRLDWDFVDLDERIEWRERQTISEIFRQRGEEGFRLAETSALCDLTDSLERDTVIALGGG